MPDDFAQMRRIGDEVADVTDAGRHSARARGLDRPAAASHEFVIEQGDIVEAGCRGFDWTIRGSAAAKTSALHKGGSSAKYERMSGSSILPESEA
jgi:hypothetical protein